MPQIELNDEDALQLRGVLEAKLKELRREESHTDSPRYRSALYELDASIERVLAQIPPPVAKDD